MQQTNKTQTHKRTFNGMVITKSGDKSIRVRVESTKEHPKYHKKYRVSRKYMVHDEKNQFKVGDTVQFVECRPLSKSKRWRVTY